jgi:hypothetical protein
MFQWSKKVVKSVTFNPDITDESLLAQVESYLEAKPEKNFSDLCKEALWQVLCVPDSELTVPHKSGMIEQQIGDLQRQIASLEQRFFAKESNRLEMVERQIYQLTQQVAQLAISLERPLTQQPPTAVVNNPTYPPEPSSPPQEVDPVISRISQFLDDF